MTMYTYIEDAFTALIEAEDSYKFMESRDSDICYNFNSAIETKRALTANQRSFILSLMSKYNHLAKLCGVEYPRDILPMIWKTPERVINRNKYIWVASEENNVKWICMQFPYALKQEFDDTIKLAMSYSSAMWSTDDPNNKFWKLRADATNLIAVNEFITKHDFGVDKSFADMYAQYEEFLVTEHLYIPSSDIIDNRVNIINGTDSATTWFDSHATDDIDCDLFLAKSLGYYYTGLVNTTVKQIAASHDTDFWMSSFEQFLTLSMKLPGQIGIILDRGSKPVEWLVDFMTAINAMGIPQDEVKLCFKMSNGENGSIRKFADNYGMLYNVKDNKDVKFLIIIYAKPPKWVFENNHTFSILATNGLYPSPTKIMNTWIRSHPCSIYLGSIRPSPAKGQHIVKL